MSDRIQARWLPLYPVDVPGQGVIAHGDLAWVGAGEAKVSDHWGEPVKAAPAAADHKSDDKAKT